MLEMKKKCGQVLHRSAVDFGGRDDLLVRMYLLQLLDEIHHGVCPNCEGMLIKRPPSA